MDIVAYKNRFIKGIDKYDIPPMTREALIAYVLTGRPVGSFLQAVLSNNLFGAVSQADQNNQEHLIELVRAIYNNAPMDCCGSEEKIEKWRKHRGMEQFKNEDPR